MQNIKLQFVSNHHFYDYIFITTFTTIFKNIFEFKKILKEINWVGPVEFEFIRDSFDEEFKLIEINCRFPAWISYAKDVGYNLPLTAIDLAQSKKLTVFIKIRI